MALSAYCERSEVGFWAEPYNAVSNIAFIIAAILVIHQYSRRSDLNFRNSWDFLLLILCLCAIGTGSGLWHTIATRWAKLADVIPIALFINLFLLSFLYRIGTCGVKQIIIFFLLFQLLNYATMMLVPREFLNGSAGYFPAYIALLIMTVYSLHRRYLLASGFAIAAVIFPISLFFRTIDPVVCAQFPVGSHFLWHLLNAMMLYILLRSLLHIMPVVRR